MGVLVLNRESEQESGLRALDVLHDLDGVGRLIDIAFAEDIAREGSDLRRDLLLLMAASPLLWALRRISGELRDAFDGFVWLENGRIVGNVTLTRDDPARRLWTISNVAVHPDFRRRGIARALMQASLESVAERGGGPVALEVRANNRAAYDLYVNQGFRFVDGALTARRAGPLNVALPQGGRARRVHDDEMPAVYALALAAQAPLARRIAPPRREQYVRGGLRQAADRLGDLWAQERRFWLAIERADAFSAAARLHLQPSGAAAVDLVIDSEGHGDDEEALLQSALAACARYGTITVRAASGDEAAHALLWSYGFSEVRHLHRLVRDA